MQISKFFKSSLDFYREQELENHNVLMNYHQNPRRDLVDISSIIGLLDESKTKYMISINHSSRVIMTRHLVDVMGEARDFASNRIFFSTFAPGRYVFPLDEAGTFKPASLKKMITSYMRSHNYIGMIEPAFYPHAPHVKSSANGVVHWHAHLIE